MMRLTDSLSFLKLALLGFLFLSPGECHSEDLQVRRPSSRVGGMIGAFCLQDKDHLWAGEGTQLVLFNVADPSNIHIEARLPLVGALRQIIKRGEVLYVIGRSRKWWVVDVHDPLNPRILKEHTFEAEVNQLSFLGDQGFFLSVSTVRVFDFSNPKDPKPIQDLPVGSYATMIYIEGSVGLVAVPREGIRAYDLSAANGPDEVGRYPIQKYSEGFAVVDGTDVWVTENQMGIHGIDFSHPEDPKKFAYVENRSVIQAPKVFGHFLFLPGVIPDLTVYDISDREHPEKVAEIDSPARIEDVFYADGRIYIPSDGLKVYDFTDPRNPVLLGQYKHVHLPQYVYYLEGIAYVGGDSSQLAILDCTHPEEPVLRGFFPLDGVPTCLAGVKDLLYAFTSTGLEIIDLKDPTHPVRIRKDTRFAKTSLFASNGDLGVVPSMKILDLSDPTQPEIEAGYGCGTEHVSSACFLDSFLLITMGGGFTQVVDLRYPFSPVFKTFFPVRGRQERKAFAPGSPQMAWVGKTAVFCSREAHATWFDFTDPLRPKKLGELEETSELCTAWKDRIFLTGYLGGWEYDFSDPARPKKVGRFQGGLGRWSVVYEDLLFDPSITTGLRIFRLTDEK